MNFFRIAKIIIVFSSLSYLSVTFLRNYNSPDNIEKRCILKFEKDFKNNLETSHEEWNKIYLLGSLQVSLYKQHKNVRVSILPNA